MQNQAKHTGYLVLLPGSGTLGTKYLVLSTQYFMPSPWSMHNAAYVRASGRHDEWAARAKATPEYQRRFSPIMSGGCGSPAFLDAAVADSQVMFAARRK